MTTKQGNLLTNPWKKVIADASRLLHRALPGNNLNHTANKKQFLKDLEGDKKRMAHLRKKLEINDTRGGQVVKDWYDAWVKRRTITPGGASGNYDDGDDFNGEDGGAWTTQGRRGRPQADLLRDPPSSRTTRPPTTSSTTASSRTTARPGPAPRAGNGVSRPARGEDPQGHDGDTWKDLQPADDSPLVDPSGDEAKRLDITAAVSDASGYHFCSSTEAARLRAKFAMAPQAVTFIVPFVDHATLASIRDGLKRESERKDGLIAPSAMHASIFVKEPSTGTRRRKEVYLIHVDSALPILPSHLVNDGMLFASPLPNLKLDVRTDIDVQVAVMAPVCAELGLEEWWKRLAARPFPLFKEDLKKLLTSSKFKPAELRVRMNRTVMWRGEEMKDARILATVRVPRDQVDELMMRSGRHGLIVDKSQRGDDMDDLGYAKVKLPLDWTAAEANAKIDELPPGLKKATRGIVPTFRGYSLRVIKSMEADVVKALLPELAAELGPALGLCAASAWVLRGVPRDATKEHIIKAFSTVTSAWEGWTVRPRRTLGQPRHGKTDWVVDAACDPPLRSITVNERDCIAIDRYTEAKKTPPKAAPWFKDHKPEPEIVRVGGLWSDVEDEDDQDSEFVMHNPCNPGDNDENQDSEMLDSLRQQKEADSLPSIDFNLKSTSTDTQPVGTMGIARRMQAAGFRANPYAAAPRQQTSAQQAPQQQVHHQQPSQRMEAGAGGAMDSQVMEMLMDMRRENEQKDAMIQQLQGTIKALNDQIAALSAAMQQQIALQQQMQQQQVPPQPLQLPQSAPPVPAAGADGANE